MKRKLTLQRAAVTIGPVIVILCMMILPFRFYRICYVTKDGRRLATVGEIFTDSKTEELVRALSRLDADTAEKLIQQGADINARGAAEVTPLLYFVAHERTEAVELALRLGADPDFAAGGYETALDYAIQTDRWQELMKILVNSGADVGMASDFSRLSKNTSLEHRVLVRLNWEAFRGNAEAGTAESDAVDDARSDAKAPQAGTVEPLLWLLNHGGDVNAQDYTGRTLLFVADGAGRHDLTLELLEQGANPFVKTREGRSFAQWFETDKAKADREFRTLTLADLNRPGPPSAGELEQLRFIQEKIQKKIDLLRQDPQKIREAREIDAAYAQFLENYRRMPHGARNLRNLQEIGGIVEKLENLVEQAERTEGEQREED